MPHSMDPRFDGANSWSEYRRLVTQSLKDLDQDIKDITKDVNNMRYELGVEIAQLKVKSAFWGAIAGVVVTVIGTVIVDIILRR